MSRHTVREFLRSASCSEDEEVMQSVSSWFKLTEFDESLRKSQSMLRRHDTIFDYDYRYRNDHLAYPSVKPCFVNVHHVIIMVGLPARGKTYISRKLCRYLNWCGISAKVVNAAEYRRKIAGSDLLHDFFDEKNKDAEAIRLKSYEEALMEGKAWLEEDEHHKVFIYDASNCTKQKRHFVYKFCEDNGYKPFFIESLCDDKVILQSFLQDVQKFSPDYVAIDKELALEDFKLRIKHYEDTYEELADKCDNTEREFSYIKTINAGRQYLVNNIDGYLQSQIVYYLMNIHTIKRSLYITAHGECDYNVSQEIGGNNGLSNEGKKFAKALQNYMNSQKIEDLKIWTSSLQGPKETADYISGVKEMWRALDYLDCGEYHGYKFSELAEIFPDMFTNSKGPLDFHWRYPGGESYHDMLSRLEPVIMELERQYNVLVICHRTTLRCLMAYFLDHNPDEVARIRVPLHTVFKLTPNAYGCRVEKAMLDESGNLTTSASVDIDVSL